jgi:hydroxyacylglutathione hydrolase
MSAMINERVVVGPFQCNCRILICPVTREAALIDAGDDATQIIQRLNSFQAPHLPPITLKWLLHTHGHLDHIGATRKVHEDTNALIALHRGDEFIYNMLPEQGKMFGMSYDSPSPVQHFLEHEEEIKIGRIKLTVIHSPGHSPGSVGFRLHENSVIGAKETLFSGDTLFQGSVGRTDLWGADGDLMFKMIKERFLTLDGDTRICPGHGGDSRIGDEKTSNPYLK